MGRIEGKVRPDRSSPLVRDYLYLIQYYNPKSIDPLGICPEPPAYKCHDDSNRSLRIYASSTTCSQEDRT
jgi:hypothetical protein